MAKGAIMADEIPKYEDTHAIEEPSVPQYHETEAIAAPMQTSDEESKPNIFQSMMQGGASALKMPASALKAGLETLTTPSNTDESLVDKFGKNYKAANQELVQEQEEAQKAHPIATTVGQIGATAPIIASAGPTVAAQTGVGGVLGLLGSSAQNPSELASDVGKNALLSGGISAGLKGAGTAIKTVAEPYVRDIPYLRQLVVAVKTGNTAMGDTAREALVNSENATAQDLANTVVKGDNALGKNIQNVINKASEEGYNIELDKQTADDMQKFLTENRTRLSQGSYNRLVNQVKQFQMSDSVSPIEINNFKKEFQEATAGFSNPDTIDIKNNVINSINDTLNEIPGYTEANKLFHDFRNSIAEPLLNEGKDNPKYLSDMNNWQEALKNKFQNVFQKLGFSSESANPAMQSLSSMKKSLSAFAEQHPGELEKIGVDPDNLLKTIKSQADVSAVRIRQTGEAGGGGLLEKAVGMAGAAPMTGAAMVGKATRGAAGIINRFGSATPEELTQAGQKLMQDPDLKYLGDSLSKAVSTNNDFLKNASIFKILQNPRAREVLGGHSDEK